MKKLPTFQPGDKVRFHGKFLRSTGQAKGMDAYKTFTVLRQRDSIVTVDERSVFDYTPEEVAADPLCIYRHVSAYNLYVVGTLTSDNDP